MSDIYYPDDYLPSRPTQEDTWDFACEFFQTDHPTADQLERAADILEDRYDRFGEYDF